MANTSMSFSNQPFDPRGKVCVVTGGSSGIGAALCLAFADAGASAVIVSDIVDNDIGTAIRERGVRSMFVRADVAAESDVASLIERTELQMGPIDMFVANAGVGGMKGGVEMTGRTTSMGRFPSKEEWDRVMGINFHHVIHASKHLIPRYLDRGSGHIMITASAAGLLTTVGSITYSASKAAAVSVAEWLSVSYGSRGVGVSCLCPQFVRTDLTKIETDVATQSNTGVRAQAMVQSLSKMMDTEELVACCLKALREGKFLILPHKEVGNYVVAKAKDRDRWIHGMRRLNEKYLSIVSSQSAGSKPLRSKL